MKTHPAIAFAARYLLPPGILFVTTALSMAMLYGVFAHRGGLIYVWPVTGVQLALLLSSNRTRDWRRFEIAGASTAVLVVGLVLHTPFWTSVAQAFLQAFELSLLLRLLSGKVQHFDDLKKRIHVALFLLSAVVGSTITAVIANLISFSHVSLRQAWMSAALPDSLGIVVFSPALLFLLSGRLWRKDQAFERFQAGSAASLLFVAALLAIFSQNSNPILFMIFPPLILAVFVLGLRGAIFTSLVSAVIACGATASGHGPMWIAHGVTMEHRIFVLQIFLWAVVASGLPVGSLLDEQRVAEKQAHKNQAIYQTLVQNSEDMIILSRLDGTSRFASPAVEKVTGWTAQEYAALPPLGAVHPEDRDLARAINVSLSEGKANHTFRYRALHKEGGFCWVEAFVRGYADIAGGPIMGYVATVRDISALKQTEESWSAEKHALASRNEQLADLAARDELTGLPNRRTFNNFLASEAARQSRSTDSLSLLMIDVDSFKKFNDRYGHQAGDTCLVKVASVFKQCAARAADLPARVGGEEFGVLLPQTDGPGAIRVATEILEAIRRLRLVHEDSPTGFVSVSIGISTWIPYQSSESTQLIQQADRALYESKRSGRNRLTVATRVRETAFATPTLTA